MRSATVFALLILAGAASAGGPPAADLSVLFVLPTQHIDALHGRQCSMAEPGAIPEGRYWCDLNDNQLLQPGRGDARLTANAASSSGAAAVTAGMPAWKRAGIYTLEFTAASVGALIAEAGGLTTIEGVYQAGWNGPGSVPGAAAYCLTSAVLSAGGTHLVGKLCGRGNAFKRALAGGALGGLLGGAAFYNYFVTRRNAPSAMIPIGLILPPLCTVIVYNVWRNDGAK